MAKDPAFLFYSSDFLTGTMTMTDEQVGKYIRLLCLQHQKKILSENDMIFICKTQDNDIYSKFIKTEEGFYNERLRFEAEKRAEFVASRGRNKAGKGLKIKKSKHMKNISKSYDFHMEIENENINDNYKLIIHNWIKYKIEIKDNYVSYNSVKAFIKNLLLFSDNNYKKAEFIINKSIGNNWKGIFQLKENEYKSNQPVFVQ